MWQMNVSGGELVLRAVLVYAALLVMMRLSGKRTVGQLTPFDLLVVMLVGEAAGTSMTGDEQSVQGGLLVCAILIALNTLMGMLSARSLWAQRLLEGEAVLIGRDGQIFDAVRKKHRVSRNDIESALREADCSLADMRCMFLEADGKLSNLQSSSDSKNNGSH
ncbi:MAG: DUF421 domain-containing protein [Comamonas sp.]|nr:DUF421 domain-containing protein [Comamonas sp.]